MGIGWRAVVVGFVVSLASGWLFVILAMHPALHPQSSSSSSGAELISVPLAYVVMVVDEAEIFLALLAAHFLGGIVAGRLSPDAPAYNGVATAAASAPVGIAYLVWAVPPFAILPFVDPFTGSLDSDMFSFWAVAFSLFFVLALLAGQLGGRLGGRLRRPSFGEDSPA